MSPAAARRTSKRNSALRNIDGVIKDMKTIVVGDVHGCIDECRELVSKTYKRGDRLVFLGDLIDKGPDPAGVVRYVRGLGAECILGNHEEKVLRWFRHEDRKKRDTSYINPIKVTPEHAEEWRQLSADDVAWLRRLPTMLRLSNGFVAVHGGFLPGISLEGQPTDKIVRLRWVDAAGEYVPLQDGSLEMPDFACPWMDVWDGDEHVVYGHAVHGLGAPRIDKTDKDRLVVGIDTGCVYGGNLTAMILNEEGTGFFAVKAKKAYCKRPING